MSAPSHAVSPLRGILLVLTAVALFACLDVAGKHLMTKFNVPLVSTVRYGLNLIILAALVGPRHGARLWHTQRTRLVVLRGVALAGATFFMGLALQRMPVGETVAIIYLQGFGVMLAAGFFLRERISAIGWVAAAVGFAGVLLIARPGGALQPLGVVFALICSCISVTYIILSRLLVATETVMSLLFHVALAGFTIFTVMLLFDTPRLAFSTSDVALLIFVGAGSLGGHFLLTSAYRFAPASMLAPFNYFHIAFATLLGWLVYNHVPDHLALMGMTMIGVAGAAIALHTHGSRPKRKDA